MVQTLTQMLVWQLLALTVTVGIEGMSRTSMCSGSARLDEAWESVTSVFKGATNLYFVLLTPFLLSDI